MWLGRPNLTTTEICTRGAPTKQLDAIDVIVPPRSETASGGRQTNG